MTKDWYQKAKTDFKITSVDLDRLKSFEAFDDGDEDPLLITVVDLYVEAGPAVFDALSQSVKKKVLLEIHNAAHALKSSSANLGAKHLAELLDQLEDQTDPEKKVTQTDFVNSLAEIGVEFLQVCRDLEIIKFLACGKAVPERLLNKAAA